MIANAAPARADAVVVGAGIAGLATALALAPRSVVLLAAAPLGQGASSVWAQGGIAAAVGEGDRAEDHAADTLTAGAGLSEADIAALVAAEGPARIFDLIRRGVPFDRDGEGRLALGREAAHGRNRILHAGGDATGAVVTRALINEVRACPSIKVIDGAQALSLLLSGEAERVAGVIARRAGTTLSLLAPAVVLATGGVGALYRHTTNPAAAGGEGLAMAARAGAVLADLEFVQFHPTALDVARDPLPLVSEAVRGEGAVLLDGRGRRFMTDRHPLAELAPRDVVARAIHRARSETGRVYLDATDAVGTAFADRFPTIYGLCMGAGIDPARQPIPVVPAAHYHMGGIAVDDYGRSSVPGLYAVGEVACTGLHGGNRLASNSLIEALVFAPRLAAAIDGDATPIADGASDADRCLNGPVGATGGDRIVIAAARAVMERHVGVERDADGLLTAIRELARAETDIRDPAACNRLLAARLIATAAWRRRESRGAHLRRDCPVAGQVARRSRLTLAEADRLLDIERRDRAFENAIELSASEGAMP